MEGSEKNRGAVRDGPLENLWVGGGGGGEVQKNYSSKGKLNEKNSCTPINPKKYSCNGLKEINITNLITKKIYCGSKIPTPTPHNFSNGPSLITSLQLAFGRRDRNFMPFAIH